MMNLKVICKSPSANWLLLWTEWQIEGFWKSKDGRLRPWRVSFVEKVGLEVMGGIRTGAQSASQADVMVWAKEMRW